MFFKLAWLNIWRSKGRTFIMVFSIAFAVFFSTINQSNKIGMIDRLIKNSVGFYSGYLQIHKNGFWENRSINSCFKVEDSTIRALTNTFPIEKFVPRIESFSMAAVNEKTRGVTLIGIDPVPENSLTGLAKKIISGKYLLENDNEIMVGKGVADFFKKEVGDTIDFIGQGYHGANAVNRYRIKAIVQYPVAWLNNSVVYLPLKATQNFFGIENLVTTYCLKVDLANVDSMTPLIAAKFGTEDFEVMSWKAMMPELLQFINLLQFMNIFVYFILYLILGFGLFSTYYMMLIERSYEFGIMIASGMKRRILQTITMTEVILMALAGLCVGLLISFIFLFYFQNNPIPLTGEAAAMYIKQGLEPFYELPLTYKPFVIQSIVVFLLSLCVGTYSIRKINKLDVTAAIR